MAAPNAMAAGGGGVRSAEVANFFCKSVGDRGQLIVMIARFDSTSNLDRIERLTYSL